MNKFLAIDLGASSYRMILGDENGLNELFRYNDHLVTVDEVKYWDITTIYNHIIDCLKWLKTNSIRISSLAINSWGCDFAPILNTYKFDINGRLEDQIYGSCYLNGPSKRQEEKVNMLYSDEQLFNLTGIHKQSFNSIYRLPDIEGKVTFIASYLEMLLTGSYAVDCSIASTTQIFDREKNEYNKHILKALKINQKYLPKISTEKVRSAKIMHKNYNHIDVVSGTGHDTSYAFYRYDQETIIVNVGSWIICGMNSDEPREFSLDFNYERGLKSKYKVVSNTLGMNGFNLLLQEFRKGLSFEQVAKLLIEANCNEVCDLSNLDLSKSISQQLPTTEWIKQVAIYLNSIATITAMSIENLNNVSNQKVKKLVLIGGGSKNEYFIKQLEQKLNDKYKISFGESEATVLGNIKFQMEVKNGTIKES